MFTQVAIIGRPNVGKSTLFNRLTGKQHAIVDDTPGVTRDRRYGAARISSLEFTAIDTAGLDADKKNDTNRRIQDMTIAAMKEAKLIMFVVDARAGITEEDKHFARLIRKQNKPVILVMNKAEAGHAKQHLSEAFRLGFGDPVALSAAHGEGLADLYSALAAHVPETEAQEAETSEENEENQPLQIAIVGRPNVGKSTFINQLLGEDRVLAGPEAGLTRDAIAVDFTYQGRKLKLVDTAGMRRKTNITAKVEKLAVSDSLRAIQYAHVVILVIDATQPLEKQDNVLAGLIEQEGRAMILALNKWDQVKEKHLFIKEIISRLSDVMPQVKDIPVIPMSALTGKHIEKVMEAAFAMYTLWNKRISTGALNRWLQKAIEVHSPPLVKGRRIKIRYITQYKTRPPTFGLFATQGDMLPDSYQRYLVNALREKFNMPGVPIRFVIKKTENPFAEE